MIKIDCLVSGVFFVRDHWVPYKKRAVDHAARLIDTKLTRRSHIDPVTALAEMMCQRL